MALVQLEKIKSYLSRLLERKGHVSMFLFSFITVLLIATLFNNNIYVRYKNSALILYIIYAVIFLSEKFKDTMYSLLSIAFVVILASFTGMDINNKIDGSIGSYFPMMLFNVFTIKFMLENYYNRKLNKNLLSVIISIILAASCLLLVVKGIIKTNIILLIFCLIYTVISSILIWKFGKRKL